MTRRKIQGAHYTQVDPKSPELFALRQIPSPQQTTLAREIGIGHPPTFTEGLSFLDDKSNNESAECSATSNPLSPLSAKDPITAGMNQVSTFPLAGD